MNSEEKQALIENIKVQIALIQEDIRKGWEVDSFYLKPMGIALAALEAEPVGVLEDVIGGRGANAYRFRANKNAVVHYNMPLYTAAPVPTIPDGWQLVPVDMTDETGEAIALEARCCGGIALDIYNAMLAAAPKP